MRGHSGLENERGETARADNSIPMPNFRIHLATTGIYTGSVDLLLSWASSNYCQGSRCTSVTWPTTESVDCSCVRSSDGSFKLYFLSERYKGTNGAILLGLGKSAVERPWYQSASVMTVDSEKEINEWQSTQTIRRTDRHQCHKDGRVGHEDLQIDYKNTYTQELTPLAINHERTTSEGKEILKQWSE